MIYRGPLPEVAASGREGEKERTDATNNNRSIPQKQLFVKAVSDRVSAAVLSRPSVACIWLQVVSGLSTSPCLSYAGFCCLPEQQGISVLSGTFTFLIFTF
jgi:hypothetical protein